MVTCKSKQNSYQIAPLFPKEAEFDKNDPGVVGATGWLSCAALDQQCSSVWTWDTSLCTRK
jgi:hypothetical protein